MQPDTRPGHYYVSVRRANDTRLLSGPYIDNHTAALRDVKACAEIACQLDPWGDHYAYGTVRMSATYTEPGILNRLGKFEVSP